MTMTRRRSGKCHRQGYYHEVAFGFERHIHVLLLTETRPTTKKIKDLTVFIYNATAFAGERTDCLFGTLTEGADNVFTTKALDATTGTKTIFVAANATTEIKQVMKANTANGLSGRPWVQSCQPSQQPTVFIFSTTGHTGDLVEVGDANYATNNVKVTLQRLASVAAV